VKVRYWFRLISGPYFSSSASSYDELMAEWFILSNAFKGWTLTEIQNLSHRERANWIEVSKEYRKAVSG